MRTSFLEVILKSSGYSNIEITRGIKDGGVDVYCEDGEKKVHVSAKRWRQGVHPKEVREIRGTGGDFSVLVCLRASRDAKKEAEKSDTKLPPARIISDNDLVSSCIKAGLIEGISIRQEWLPSFL